MTIFEADWICPVTAAPIHNAALAVEGETIAVVGAEVMDLGVSWQAMREFGLRGIAYQEVFGPAPSQTEEAIAGLRKKIDEYRRDETDTFRAGVSPHAPYTVSAKLFGELNDYADH